MAIQRENELTAIVLAGGKSSRMGRDKAFLDWQGKPLIQQVVQNLKRFVPEVLVIAKEYEKFDFLKTPIYRDLVTNFSPLAGIYTGLVFSRTELNWVVACDMPFLTAAVLKRLKDSIEDFDAVIPESDFGWEPLCGLYRKRCGQIFKRHLELGELEVKTVLKDLAVKIAARDEWPPEELRSFLNANTPVEYARAQGERNHESF